MAAAGRDTVPAKERDRREQVLEEDVTEEERRERIQLEVDAWWHLKVEEAAHRLIARAAYREAAE